MNVKKLAVVLIALLAGGAAFYLTLSGQSNTEQPVTIVESKKEETIGVLVASTDIARGTSLSPENLKWEDWPKKTVEKSGHFLTGASGNVLEELQGAVAKNAIYAGEPLVEPKIVRAGSRGLMAALLTPGMRAVSLRVTAETSSGGFILPGDFVDVVFTSGGGRNSQQKVSTIFENVRVLAVNEIFSDDPEVAVINGVNVTMEMNPENAQKFIAARAQGNLSLTLRSIYEKSTAAPEAVEQQKPKKKKVKIIRVGRS